MNEWAKRKANIKKDRRETARSLSEMQAAKFNNSERYKTKRVKNERASTAARRERSAIYGKMNPANATSLCCHMMVINGECSGCGE